MLRAFVAVSPQSHSIRTSYQVRVMQHGAVYGLKYKYVLAKLHPTREKLAGFGYHSDG